MRWLKSKQCESGACVEVARVGQQIAIRDQDGNTIQVDPQAYHLWAADVQAGVFDVDGQST